MNVEYLDVRAAHEHEKSEQRAYFMHLIFRESIADQITMMLSGFIFGNVLSTLILHYDKMDSSQTLNATLTLAVSFLLTAVRAFVQLMKFKDAGKRTSQ